MFSKALVCAVLAAVAVPATAFAHGGVVVKVDRSSALTAVAGAHGSVALVHSKAAAKVGERVSFDARRLRNGTLAATSMRVTGEAKRVRVRGLVLAHRDSGFVMSAGGAALTVNTQKQDAPPVGSSVVVTATVAGGELEQENAQPVLTDARSGSIEGHLVQAPAGSIAVRSGGLTLVIAVPSTVDVSKLMPGDEVLASFQRQADGSLVLTAISADDQSSAENEDESGDDDGGRSGSSSGGTIGGTVGGTSSGHSVGGHGGGGGDD